MLPEVTELAKEALHKQRCSDAPSLQTCCRRFEEGRTDNADRCLLGDGPGSVSSLETYCQAKWCGSDTSLCASNPTTAEQYNECTASNSAESAKVVEAQQNWEVNL